jgi:hypothetical protein
MMKNTWTVQEIIERLPEIHNELGTLFPIYTGLKNEYDTMLAEITVNPDVCTGSNQTLRDAQAKTAADIRFGEVKLHDLNTVKGEIAQLKSERDILFCIAELKKLVKATM